nr:Flp pilus assembly complex ATPase component TadA [Deltaproteobacteria bacterium]
MSDFEPSARVIGMLPTKLILQHRAVPLRLQGNRLLVGMVLPRHAAALADLRRVLHTVDFEVAAISLEDFAQTVLRFKLDAVRGAESTRDSIAVISPESLAYDAADSEREPEKGARVVGDEVVRAVNRVVAAALSRDASDIHIEPEAAGVKVRFRVHGTLHDWGESLPPSFARGVAARLKVLSGLDITNTRTPQDGRIGLTAGSRELDLRISTLPSSRGEKVVLRVFEGSGMMRPLEQIFSDAGSLNAVRKALQRPHGAIIVAGATGSGKSSTLYSMLNERRRSRPDTNLLLIEDPIEYRLAGVTQVQVHAGLGFSQVLRAAMRQDPGLAERGSQVALPRPVGCDLCQQTGYQGRIAVVEWWQVTPEARDALVAGASHNDVLRAAAEARMLQTFRHNAAYLMARKALGTSEALMAVAG